MVLISVRKTCLKKELRWSDVASGRLCYAKKLVIITSALITCWSSCVALSLGLKILFKFPCLFNASKHFLCKSLLQWSAKIIRQLLFLCYMLKRKKKLVLSTFKNITQSVKNKLLSWKQLFKWFQTKNDGKESYLYYWEECYTFQMSQFCRKAHGFPRFKKLTRDNEEN